LREESTQAIFKDFLYYNEEYEQVNNIKAPTTLRNTSVKKEVLKKDMLRENNSSYTLIKKENIKKLTASPIPNLIVGNMFDKMKMDKSPSLLDNRLLKLKKSTNSFSTSSLLKNSRQMSNLSSTGTGSVNGTSSGISIISSHKRTGSSINKPMSINFKV
jgi:hypothetical protein